MICDYADDVDGDEELRGDDGRRVQRLRRLRRQPPLVVCQAERAVPQGVVIPPMKRQARACDRISQHPLRRPMEAHANRQRWCCTPSTHTHYIAASSQLTAL